MRALLVPVDGSESSHNAACYAADMALAIDADLHLLHVVQVVVTPTIMPAGYVLADMEKAGQILVDKLAEELRERTHQQVVISTLLETGGVGYVIAEVSRRLSPFAVVMGAPQGQFSRAMTGSPAVDAARHLPYPVLVIPEGAVFRRIRTIALACEDGTAPGTTPVTLSFLQELQTLFDSRFELFHVDTDGEHGDGERAWLDSWQKALQGVHPERYFIHSDSVVEGVDQYIAAHDADWLMIFPEQHGILSFHKSRSKALIMHCTTPVISILKA